MSVAYHNMAARYNCYFLAKERMLEVEDKIRKNYKDDFNYILPYTAPFDSTFNKSLKADLDYILEKGILPLQKHKNSHWLAESYNVIGKAKWLENKTDSAVYVYKYVLARVDDIPGKQMSQILLLRTHASNNEPRLAEEIFFQLQKQKIYEENRMEYHIASNEYLYPLRKFEEMIPHLEALIPLVKKKDKRARINFILGQIYQRLGQNDESYAYYKKSLKRNPPYELEFNAKLNLAQVSNTENGGTVKKTNKRFRNMLSDAKNDEYHGRIYYERGKYELKRNKLQRAVYYLNKSLEAPRTPAQEKTYPYLLLGKLYYSEIDTLPTKVDKYITSKLYYDSAVANMNPNFENAELILERQKILTNFVQELEIVEEEEKLQLWASLDPEELKKVVDEEIKKDREKLEREAAIKKRRELLALEAKNDPFNDVSNSVVSSQSTFFAYNPVAIESQKLKFKQLWGERKLEDNWRRSNKSSSDPFAEEETDSASIDTTNIQNDTLTITPDENQEKEIIIDTSSYTANIPNSPIKLKASNERLLEAKYQLAKIYYYDLKEIENARDEFLSYLEKFPDSDHEAEVIYFLYLISQNDKTLTTQTYVNLEKQKYPNSIYARLMDDANYLSSNEEKNRKAQNEYEKAFNQYKSTDYLGARARLENIKKTYPLNDIPDKVQYLKILTYAKTDQASKYFFEMQEFIKDFGTSPLVTNATKILAEKPVGIEITDKIDDEFYKNDSLKHYFVAVFKTSEMPFSEIDRIYNEFRNNYFKTLKISTKQIALSDSTYLVVNKEFSNLKEGKKYLNRLMDYHDFGKHLEKVEYSYYLVSSQNYKTLIATKNLDGYASFYKKKYPF